ncbi:MAG TPA: ribosome maturation factor RimM [Gemmatimonadaceae bacterium]|nr:ribosome maturation factor RimM [Gemmatimonadaceae bacterium]
MAHDALAIVGLIRNAQGIRGEVVIEPLTDAPDAVFASGRRVFLGSGAGNSSTEGERSVTVENARPFKGGMMVKFAEIPDRNAAELLRGRYVFSPFDELEPLEEGEVYLHELIGMKVKLDTGEEMGEVGAYYELPQGLTLEVKTVKGNVLVPYRAEVVEYVDSDAREVVVKAEVGIFD